MGVNRVNKGGLGSRPLGLLGGPRYSSLGVSLVQRTVLVVVEKWGLKWATCAEVQLNFLHHADVLFVVSRAGVGGPHFPPT